MKKPDKMNREFYVLADTVTKLRSKNYGGFISREDESILQEKQVNELFLLEKEFLIKTLSYDEGRKICLNLCDYLVKNKKGLKKARTFFRERSGVFKNEIGKCLFLGQVENLHKYNVNYRFISFIYNNWTNPPEDIVELYNKINNLRTLFIENNLPLAINRAKIFYSKCKDTKGTYIEYINACVVGLMQGLDKWYGPYRKVLRSSCICRMIGNMMNIQSQSVLHFYPSDKRLIYKINRLKNKLQINDLNILIDTIKNDPETAKLLNVDKTNLIDLINASEALNNTLISESQDNTDVYSMVTNADDCDIEEKIINNEIMKKVKEKSKTDLTPIQRKILKLKGIDL